MASMRRKSGLNRTGCLSQVGALRRGFTVFELLFHMCSADTFTLVFQEFLLLLILLYIFKMSISIFPKAAINAIIFLGMIYIDHLSQHQV